MNALPPDIMALLEEVAPGYAAEVENDLLAAQYKTAEKMRGAEMPGMRRYGDNRIMAANPMEMVAPVRDRIQGGRDMQQTMGQMKTNAGTMGASQKAAVMAELLRRYQTPPVAAGQPANGAMMAPDPSTMTSEAVDPFETKPWEMEPTPRPVPGKPRPKPVAPPVVMPPGSGYTGDW